MALFFRKGFFRCLTVRVTAMNLFFSEEAFGLFAGWFLGWLVLICCEKKTLLPDWFGLAETNKRTG